MHNNTKPDLSLIKAEQDYSSISATDLGTQEPPEYIAHTTNSKVKLSLRGVVGFGDIILRLVCTLDAELAYSNNAEKIFIDRWKRKHGNKTTLPSNPDSRQQKIRKLFRQIELPAPQASPQLEIWLKSLSIIA